jgi:hypothetical protein
MRDIIAGKGFGVAQAAVEEMARTVMAGVEQEPAAWILTGIDGRKYIESDKTVVEMFSCFVGNKVEPLYATPQPVPTTRKPVAYMNRFTSRVYTLDEQPGADTDTAVYAPVYLEQPAPAVEVRPIAFFDGDISPTDAEKLAAAIRELNNAPSEPAKMEAGETVPVVQNEIDENLIECMRLVQCMLEDYRDRNHGAAESWIRHIDARMSDYTDAHGDDAYMILRSLRRAAMQQPVSNRDELPVTKIKPVADLYGITSPTGSETSFTFDAIEARNFIDGGWSCQEYVELERYQQAFAGNHPVIPDGYVMVPVEPTRKMLDAFRAAYEKDESYAEHWQRMIAAAPKQEGNGD